MRKERTYCMVIGGLAMLFFAMSSLNVHAQQKPQFTHYMYNTLAVNPAYAGSRDALTVTGITRHQWVGLKGAPTTQTITLHSPILNQHIGVGMTLISDRVGPNSNLQFAGDFAYRLKVGKKGTLSLGMKAGGYYRSSRISELTIIDNDASFSGDFQTKLIPTVGAGAYFVHPAFYVGFSAPNLLESDFYQDQIIATQGRAAERRHYYLIAGGMIDLSKEVKFKPVTMVKFVTDAPFDVDLTANFLIREKFWIGGMFRLRDAVGVLAAFSFTEQITAGYSFDLPVTALRSQSLGTHEVMLSYDFKYTKKAKVRSPRYF